MALPYANKQAITDAVRQILIALGEDPFRPSLRETPDRVANLYEDILDGSFMKLNDQKTFDSENYEGAVIVHHAPFYAFCEHHMLPFIGHFGIAYVPDQTILGLSKLIRIFRHNCKRITVQERLTEQAVELVMQQAKPKGAICYVVAEHMCMALRGVKSPGSKTTTIAHRGVYSTDVELRTQFINEASK
jgi:GTP cyclohydrolase I